MSEAKYTKGPWVVRTFPTGEFAKPQTWIVDSIPDEGGKVVANAIGVVAKSNECHEGNARLIAAAPELLEALELAMTFGSQGEIDFGPHRGMSVSYFIENAIAKARGTP